MAGKALKPKPSRDGYTLLSYGSARKTAKKLDKAFENVRSFVLPIYHHSIYNRSLDSHSMATISRVILSIKNSAPPWRMRRSCVLAILVQNRHTVDLRKDHRQVDQLMDRLSRVRVNLMLWEVGSRRYHFQPDALLALQTNTMGNKGGLYLPSL